MKEGGKRYRSGLTGWIACNYEEADYIEDVTHSSVFTTEIEARECNDRWKNTYGDESGYDGIRYVDKDGYLYVDKPEAE